MESLAASGIDNFNLDLMYALPGQGVAQAEQDLRTALSFAPPHVSHYQLTIEPNTLFHRHRPDVPDDDVASTENLDHALNPDGKVVAAPPRLAGRPGELPRPLALSRRDADGRERVVVYPSRSSGVLSSVAWADGLVEIPEGRVISPGDEVDFHPFCELLS